MSRGEIRAGGFSDAGVQLSKRAHSKQEELPSGNSECRKEKSAQAVSPMRECSSQRELTPNRRNCHQAIPSVARRNPRRRFLRCGSAALKESSLQTGGIAIRQFRVSQGEIRAGGFSDAGVQLSKRAHSKQEELPSGNSECRKEKSAQAVSPMRECSSQRELTPNRRNCHQAIPSVRYRVSSASTHRSRPAHPRSA